MAQPIARRVRLPLGEIDLIVRKRRLIAFVEVKLRADQDAALKWTGGEFTEVDLGSVALRNLDIEASSFRLGVGIVWWPR